MAYARPIVTATDKGKGKAREYHPRVDERFLEIAGIFGNPAFVGQRREDSVPKQPSREALGKAAAVEDAILVGLYTQCHETSQKTWKSEKELLMLAGPWMTHPTAVSGPHLIALTSRKHLECHMRDNIPVYTPSHGKDIAQLKTPPLRKVFLPSTSFRMTWWHRPCRKQHRPRKSFGNAQPFHCVLPSYRRRAACQIMRD